MKLVYQFNRRSFLRTILQYAKLKRNSHLYTVDIDPEFKHLFSQILFSYKNNPLTVLFLDIPMIILVTEIFPLFKIIERYF